MYYPLQGKTVGVDLKREQHFMYRNQGLLQLCSREDSYCNASSSSYYKKKNTNEK